jgi:hypothetical protein
MERFHMALVQLHGALVPQPFYTAYRKLSGLLLSKEQWYADFHVNAVALGGTSSGVDKLEIFVEKTNEKLHAVLRDFGLGSYGIREIGPIFPIAAGGNSIGASGGQQTSGTFGCLVEDAYNKHYGLTCDHVVGILAAQKAGDAVLSPGVSRGGTLKSRIGEFLQGSGVVTSTTASNRSDAATVKLDSPSSHAKKIVGIGAPIGANRSYSLGGGAKKSGVATQVTRGQFSYIVTLNVPYGHHKARFVDQFAIDGGGVVFADSGDSGAVVLDDADAVVGLLFAAAPQSYLGFVNPITDVEAALGVVVA